MKPTTKLFLIFLFLLPLLSFHLPIKSAYASVPHLINYQGKLTNTASAPLSGTYNVIFRIYDASGGGNKLWEETQRAKGSDLEL